MIEEKLSAGSFRVEKSETEYWNRYSGPFKSAAICSFDEQTKMVSDVQELSGDALQAFYSVLRGAGFIATPVQGIGDYNHRILLDEKRDYFLVNWPGVRALERYNFVRMAGFVDWTDRATMFDDASAIVVPSRSEPFGMIVLEAMQHGVPVFFSDRAGVGEFLHSGIRIGASNIEAIAAAVADVLVNEERWNEVVETQRSEVKAYASNDRSEVILASTYRDICARFTRRRLPKDNPS